MLNAIFFDMFDKNALTIFVTHPTSHSLFYIPSH